MIITIEWDNGNKFPLSVNLSKKEAQELAKRIAKQTESIKQVSVEDFTVVKIAFNPPRKFTIKNLIKERDSVLSRKGAKNVV